jgi:magnesium transporter
MVELIALAVLMPIVASVGGNTGNQTTALIIRGLAQGQVSSHNIWYLVRKELSIGIVNGFALGILVGIFAQVFYHDYQLSLVIASAMVITLVFAALAGLAVPMFLNKMGKDPALGSSVIQTATTDSVGFLIFLGLATIFLSH